MIAPDTPDDEPLRLQSLRGLGLLDSPPEERFDTLTRVASRVFDAPIAVVTLVDKERQWFKSCLGIDVSETPRDISFCGHAILGKGLFEVRDATRDPRFADNPLVLGPPHIRFYAGVPLSDRDGHRLGSFAIIDRRPRRLSDADRALLTELARLVELEFERIHVSMQQAQGAARLVAQEVRLLEADRQKDRFLATLAHELRNPLAPIRNSVHVAKTRRPNDEVLARALEVIERQSAHLTRIVDDLLEVARIAHGQIILERRPCRVDQIVSEALEVVNNAAHAAGHTISVGMPSEQIWIHGDPTRVVQALQNLLSNSVKYTDPGGQILVSVRRAENVVDIEVQDNGVGIAAEQLERVFVPFAQEPRSQGRRGGGLGIGLPLARQLIEMHGGKLSAYSAGPGLGAQFVVTLPVMPAPAEPAAAASPAGAARSRTILVVDDNADLLSSTVALLEMMGHAVRTASTGRQAVAAVLAERPDLVLLDIGLPDMDGNEVARELLQRLGRHCPPMVAITGWGQAEDRRRTAESGFARHLTKPVDPEALQQVIASTL